jgi:hypothetical protein
MSDVRKVDWRIDVRQTRVTGRVGKWVGKRRRACMSSGRLNVSDVSERVYGIAKDDRVPLLCPELIQDQ